MIDTLQLEEISTGSTQLSHGDGQPEGDSAIPAQSEPVVEDEDGEKDTIHASDDCIVQEIFPEDSQVSPQDIVRGSVITDDDDIESAEGLPEGELDHHSETEDELLPPTKRRRITDSSANTLSPPVPSSYNQFRGSPSSSPSSQQSFSNRNQRVTPRKHTRRSASSSCRDRHKGSQRQSMSRVQG